MSAKDSPFKTSPHFKMLILGGQKVIHDEEFLYIWIREPYWVAWRDVAWEAKSPGLGLNREVLLHAKRQKLALRLSVGEKSDRVYDADPYDWLGFARKTRSVGYHQGTEIFVYPLKFCKAVRGSYLSEIRRLLGG